MNQLQPTPNSQSHLSGQSLTSSSSPYLPTSPSPHLPLLLILLIFAALTLYQSVTLPLGEADDETDHYQYLRFVARTGHPPLAEAERREAGFKGGLAPLYYWLTAWPIALVGEDAQPDIRRVDARPERHIPNDGLGINHLLHTLDEQWPWRGHVLAWHLVRLLSLPLGCVTIIATYALARRLSPGSRLLALGAAAFIALLPRFVISSAVINDDNLVFALIALLLLVQVAILESPQPPRPRLMALFGVLFGLTLITKYFSLILIPEILLTLWLTHRKATTYKLPHPPTSLSPHSPISPPPHSPISPSSLPPRPPTRLRLTASFLLPFLLTAGPWFIFIAARFNRIADLGLIAGLAASLGEPQITEGLVGLLSGQSVRPVAATYSLLDWLSLLYRSFWFEYGWMRIFAPAWVYTLFTIFAALALLGLIGKTLVNTLPPLSPSPTTDDEQTTTHYALRTTPHASRFAFYASRSKLSLLTLHLLLFLIVVLARYILSATIDTGQGRHLYPALPVIALLIALGLIRLYLAFSTLSARIAPLQQMAYQILPSHYSRLPTSSARLPTYFLLLLLACFLLPSLVSLRPAAFILPRYQTLPVTTVKPAAIAYPVSIPFAPDLSLLGLEVNPIASAGSALPVTLYWQAAAEARQDYLVDLCLQDGQERPVACWQGHFADGRYPARAWEAGDFLIDTIHLPIPTCARLPDQLYTLQLQLWPLDPTQATTVPGNEPVLRHTFTQPPVAIKAAGSSGGRPQTVELWQAGHQLAQPVGLELRQSLSQITYTGHQAGPSPKFVAAVAPEAEWLPLAQTPLYLPCGDGPSPFAHLAHFIVEPTLTSGPYQLPAEPSLSPANLTLRDRLLAPLTATLTFSHTLAPLTLTNDQLPMSNDQLPIINLQASTPHPPTSPSPHSRTSDSQSPTPYSLLSPSYSSLPITIRWQAQRAMAEPLIIALKLLDKDFAVAGERIATLGDRYPNLLWLPGEIIEETYPLRLNPDAPPGLYRLELSLLRQDIHLPDGYVALPILENDNPIGHNLYPLTFRLLDPAQAAPPPHPFQAQLGQQIQLTGYDLNPRFSDSPPALDLALYWQSSAKITQDYTVFTQLLGPDGQVWAQWDNPPQAGRYPITAWAETDRVVDRYHLALRDGAPAGTYRLLVGMYDPTTGQRLPATINGQPQPENAIQLTTLSFAP